MIVNCVVESGLTVTELPDKYIGNQVYELAPLAVKMTESPWQSEEAEALTEMVGRAFANKATVCVPVQTPSVAKTVYTVLALGVTTIVFV